MKVFQLLFVIVMGASLPLISGCALQEAATNGDGDGDGDGDGGNDDGEIINEPSTENFEVQVNTSTKYTVAISKNGDGESDCIAQEGEDILCVVDMYELDMWTRGYTLNVAFPSDLCEYSGFYPYFYNYLPVGISPVAVYYSVDGDGNVVAPSAEHQASFGVGSTADIYYFLPFGWVPHDTLFGAAASAAGDLRCPWDYSKVDSKAPNCCQGDYTLYSVSGGELSDTESEWGGKIGNCFDGPGIQDYPSQGGALDSLNGLPVYLLNYLDGDNGDSYSFKTSSPDSQTSIMGFGQIYAANYYNFGSGAGDHVDDGPPMLTRTIASIWGTPSLINSSAHYQYDCFDEAMEVKARIRVVAREWNEYTELLGFLTTGSGDWDTVGTETSPDQEAGDNSWTPDASYINDFADWKDVADVATNLTFPNRGTDLEYPLYGFGDEGDVEPFLFGDAHDEFMRWFYVQRN